MVLRLIVYVCRLILFLGEEGLILGNGLKFGMFRNSARCIEHAKQLSGSPISPFIALNFMF